MNDTEVWRDVPGHPGYQVSNQGRIRSYWTRSKKSTRVSEPHLLSGWLNGGYRQVRMQGKHRKVHQLVLEAFVSPRPDGKVVRHLDGNPLNNVPSNLAWGTQKENADDRAAHGTLFLGEQNALSRLTEQSVREMRAATGSTREIAARFGVAPSTAWYVLAGRTWKHVT